MLENSGLQPDILTCNLVIDVCKEDAFLHHRDQACDRAYAIYDRMQRNGPPPNSYTFTSLITACRCSPSTRWRQVHPARSSCASSGLPHQSNLSHFSSSILAPRFVCPYHNKYDGWTTGKYNHWSNAAVPQRKAGLCYWRRICQVRCLDICQMLFELRFQRFLCLSIMLPFNASSDMGKRLCIPCQFLHLTVQSQNYLIGPPGLLRQVNIHSFRLPRCTCMYPQLRTRRLASRHFIESRRSGICFCPLILCKDTLPALLLFGEGARELINCLFEDHVQCFLTLC